MAFGQLRTALRRRRVLGGAAAVAAPFASVLGPSDGAKAGALNGWAVRYASQPTISTPVPFDCDDPGYDANGSATTLRRRLYVTAPVMEPWPDEATQSALDAALSEPVFANSTLFGPASNTSTQAYPKVIARWVTPPKQVLGAGLRLEVLAFQQFGRAKLPIRAVKITGTPTTGSPVTRSCAYEKSAHYDDDLPCWGVSFADADFPSNGNADVTFTFEAFGWIGESASVRDTSGASFPSAGTLSPLVMRTVGGTIRYAYVDNVSGDNGTAVVDTVAATAAGLPYLTLTAAMTGLFAASSDASFAAIRCKNTGVTYTWDNTSPTGATRTAPNGWVTIEGDPDDSDPRANITIQTSTTGYKAIFNNGAGTYAWLRIANIGLTIAAGFQGLWNANAQRGVLWLDNVRFLNNLTASTTWLSGCFGLIVTQCDGQAGNANARVFQVNSSNTRPWLVRSVTTNRMVQANVLASITVDGSAIAGTAMSLGEATQLAAENLIAHNVKVTGWLGNSSPAWQVADNGTTATGFAIVQVELVCSNSATNPAIAFGENVALDYDNIILDYITVRGGTDQESGRINIHNDPTTNPTTAVSDQCVYTNFMMRRSLTKWTAVKDDTFHGDNEGDTGAGFLVMGWVKRYGAFFALNSSGRNPDNFEPQYFGYESTRSVSGVTYDGSGRPTAGAPFIPDNDWQSLTWDIDGVERRVDGTGVGGCREAA